MSRGYTVVAARRSGRIHDVLLRESATSSGAPDLDMYLSVDSDGPLEHLEYCFGAEFRYAEVPERRRSQFNVRVRWMLSSLTRDKEDLVTVLNETLSLPNVSDLDLVSVLDWSVEGARNALGSVHQHRSRVPGDQIERAKTFPVRPRSGALATQSLVDDLTRVVRSHPAYRSATVIIGGPDSLGEVPNLRTRLARGLAAATGKDLVILQWPAWRIAGGALRASALERRLHGPCLVVDDIWTDGATMTAIARLARASGADRVYGLAATNHVAPR